MTCKGIHGVTLRKSKHYVTYCVAVGRSTDVRDIVRLSVFVRAVNGDLELVEELLELTTMKGNTGADEIFVSW
jgi:hypothetical protein